MVIKMIRRSAQPVFEIVSREGNYSLGCRYHSQSVVSREISDEVWMQSEGAKDKRSCPEQTITE
jgi:hypothetical protein